MKTEIGLQGGRLIFFALVVTVLLAPIMPPDAHALVENNCRGCHNDALGSTATRHHNLLLSKGKQCLDCHQMVGPTGNQTPIVVRDCIACHGDLIHQGRHHQLLVEQGKQCLDCHQMVTDASGNNTPIVVRDCSVCHASMNPKTNHSNATADVSCAQCHNLGVVNEHLSRASTCYTCHSSANATVLQTILSAKTGVVVTCTSCHVGFDHVAQHNMVVTPADCAGCHTQGVVYEHTNRTSTCATCHQSTNATVQKTITDGRNNIQVSCANCHGTVNHIAQHDKAQTAAECAQCHTKTVLDEHLTRTSTCATCHSSSRIEVQNAITAGRAGTVVNCVTCHGQYNHPTAHTGKVSAPYADCNTCHITSLTDLHAQRGFQCAACHASTNTAITAAVQKGLAGQPVVCADCHNAIGGFGNHAGQHDKISLIDQTGFIAAHEEKMVYCTACHTSTNATVVKVINDGMAGIQQSCNACHTVTGNNLPPTANAGADKVVTVNQAVTFTGTGTDPDGTIASYAWNFGDGTTGSGASATKTYTTAGTYTATLTVTDNAGATASDTVLVTVQAAPTSSSVFADQVLSMQRLSSVTSSDSNSSDVTANFRDGNTTDRYLLQSGSFGSNYVIAMKLNRDALTATKVVLRVYVSSISSSRTLRIYPYQSNGTSVNTGYSVSLSTSSTGWKDIDVTSIAQRMNGYGWMKFRVTTTSSSLYVAEGAFQVQ
ncbi:PKD domain-containing protein [Geobacter hydrogenophilus]|uniref:Cytochrome c n=2 Tax=Geobacter hydrogenophilus TaxID=40983 RepID=A0A9W6LCA1_9BACT|nr:PKD domain-containing protein [Geobacter hydrogenophilus]GLI38623.1 cytochrome c [Geobacter hydrogenophilus]